MKKIIEIVPVVLLLRAPLFNYGKAFFFGGNNNMESSSNKFLKVTGILMIIGGSIGLIVGIIAVIGVGVLAAALGVNSGLLTFSVILALVSAIVSFIAGIIGVKNAARPEKANVCIVFGVLAALMAVLGMILNAVAGGNFSVINMITGFALPVLYLIGAFQNKSRVS